MSLLVCEIEMFEDYLFSFWGNNLYTINGLGYINGLFRAQPCILFCKLPFQFLYFISCKGYTNMCFYPSLQVMINRTYFKICLGYPECFFYFP